jgi:hypothetical protein
LSGIVFSEIARNDGASYYARRSARDPEWRERQLREARERERRRREEDPQSFLSAHRKASRRYRARLRRKDPKRWRELKAKRAALERERRALFSPAERAEASRAAVERKRRRRARAKSVVTDLAPRGLTFEELLERSPIGDAALLRRVLSSEIELGRVEFDGDVYSVNGGLDPGIREALLALRL